MHINVVLKNHFLAIYEQNAAGIRISDCQEKNKIK